MSTPPPHQFPSNSKVTLHNLTTLALNSRTGTVQSISDVDPYRVTVRLDPIENAKESEDGNVAVESAPQTQTQIISIKPINLILNTSQPPSSQPDDPVLSLTNSTPIPAAVPVPRPRPASSPARPGDFILGYDWRDVSEGQSLPRGLEVMLSLDSSIKTIARIPPKWKLDVNVSGVNVRVQIDGRSMTINDVLNLILSKYSPPNANGEEEAEFYIDGVVYEGSKNNTIENVKIFGKKIGAVFS